MNRLLAVLAVLAALWLLTAAPVRAQPAAPAASAVADDALFRALGGNEGIGRIVDDFVPRLVADPRTAEFFRNARQAHLQQMLALQLCAVSGGGCVYTGQSMPQAHRDMDISKADFNALVEVLQSAMSAQGVPFATQNRLLARLAPMHRDIVSVH